MSGAMQGVNVETASGVTLIHIRGPLKLGEPCLDDLRSCFQHLASIETVRLVLDLEGVPAIDASGIGVLVQAYTSLKSRNGECRLLNPNRMTREMLRVAGLLSVFQVYQDRNAVLTSFSRAA